MKLNDFFYLKKKNPVTLNDFLHLLGLFEKKLDLELFIFVGRFEDSQVFSELVYLASNLLILVNDTIIKNASKVIPKIVSYLKYQ